MHAVDLRVHYRDGINRRYAFGSGLRGVGVFLICSKAVIEEHVLFVHETLVLLPYSKQNQDEAKSRLPRHIDE